MMNTPSRRVRPVPHDRRQAAGLGGENAIDQQAQVAQAGSPASSHAPCKDEQHRKQAADDQLAHTDAGRPDAHRRIERAPDRLGPLQGVGDEQQGWGDATQR